MAHPGLGPPHVAPPRAPLGPPYSPSAVLNLNHTSNMSGNSLTDALILLSGAYLSVVQPAPSTPKAGLFTIFPKMTGDFNKDLIRPFEGHGMMTTLSKYRNIGGNLDISSSWSKSDYSPRKLLDILCNEVFGNNTITVFYMNNAEALKQYRKPTVEYLPQIISSLGLPIISYDTQFSFNRRTPLSIQLAPTMGQMMDVLFAFLKKYNWTDFSFLCTLSKGCLDEIAAIRLKVEESHRRPVTTIFGVQMFSFNLLSYVNFTDGGDSVEVEEKLRHELDRDTRVILVHGNGAEVKSILDVAKDLGLTGREYVWIFTSACITIFKETSPISKSYPLGSFVIGFDSKRDHMGEVISNALDLWLQALNSLAGSPEFDEIDFDTGFSCKANAKIYNNGNGGMRNGGGNTTHHTAMAMRWKYGNILYKHLLKSKLKGSIEFDQHGILKSNKFWIRNIQIAGAPSRSSSSSRFGSSRSSGSSGGYKPPPRAIGSGGSRSGPTRSHGGGAPRRPPTRTSSTQNRFSKPSSVRDRQSGGASTSSRDRSSRLSTGRNRFSGGNSRERERGGSSGNPRNSRNRERDSRTPSRLSQYSGTRRLRNLETKNDLKSRSQDAKISTQRSDIVPGESELLQTTEDPLEGEDKFVVGDSNPSKEPYSISSSTRGIIDGKDDDDMLYRRQSETSPSGGSRLFGWGRNADSPVTPRDWRDRSRSRRATTRSRRHIAKKIADWDGHRLTISSITWPGGASKPPKGKPEKYVLRVATWHEDPHVIFVDPDNTTGECDSHSLPCTVYVRDPVTHVASNNTNGMCCTGLAMDLLKRLSEELHIDVDLHEARSGSYGSPLDANLTSWTGLMGMLTRNEADLVMSAMAITPERSAAVEFSMPFLQTGITIVVALRAGVISPTAFLEPYDYLSWTLILVFSVHATGTSIFIFEWLSPYGLDHGKTPLSVHKFSLFRSFWLIWAMLFGASVSTDMPRGCASRFLANIWALFAVVFCASYTANLAAFMITKDDFYDLSGIQDWRLRHPHHRQPPFKFATITNSSTDTNIRKNYPQIHSFMSDYGQYDVKEAVAALKNQEIQAFIYDSTTLEYEVGKDVGCKLKTVGKRIAETGYGVAFPKKSQWTKKFNVALLRLQEDGEIERIQKFWLAGACHKKKEGVGVSSHTLGILNFTSAFILLGGGIILGALLMTLEHMYFRFGRKQLKKWDRYGCCSLVSLSMGQSLTFERSVFEAIDFHKHHKCKDPICETQLWKVKHELDLALLKISQLRKQIAYTNSEDPTEDAEEIPGMQAIGGREDYPTGSNYQNGTTTEPRRRRQSKSDEARQDTATKSLLHSNDDDDDDAVTNTYSLLQDGNNAQSNQHKPKPKPPPRNSSYSSAAEPELKPAVKPRPPAKRPHERSNNHAHSRDNGRDSQVEERQKQQPHGNKIHPQKEDVSLNNLQQQSFPDPRSNTNNYNNPNTNNFTPTSVSSPPLHPPPYSSVSHSSRDSPAPLVLSSPSDLIDNNANNTSYPSPPSPPLPPPPTPPPFIENIQDPCSNDDNDDDISPISSAPSSRPISFPNNPHERSGAITPAPTPSSSDATMYEPVVLDPTARSYAPSSISSPSSPTPSTSSSSQASHNAPLSPGGVSELSNEGMSLPSSPDRLSYSSDTFANPNNTTNTQQQQQPTHHNNQSRDDENNRPATSLSSTLPPQAQGNSNSTNPFHQQTPDYSNTSTSGLDNTNTNTNIKSSEPNREQDRGKNGDLTSMTSLKEADNDVDSRRARKPDGNVYVNVDDIGGKETTF